MYQPGAIVEFLGIYPLYSLHASWLCYLRSVYRLLYEFLSTQGPQEHLEAELTIPQHSLGCSATLLTHKLMLFL